MEVFSLDKVHDAVARMHGGCHRTPEPMQEPPFHRTRFVISFDWKFR